MEKFLACVVAAVAVVFGFWAQAYGLPRIGLEALTLGEYIILDLLMAASAVAVTAFKYLVSS